MSHCVESQSACVRPPPSSIRRLPPRRVVVARSFSKQDCGTIIGKADDFIVAVRNQWPVRRGMLLEGLSNDILSRLPSSDCPSTPSKSRTRQIITLSMTLRKMPCLRPTDRRRAAFAVAPVPGFCLGWSTSDFSSQASVSQRV